MSDGVKGDQGKPPIYTGVIALFPRAIQSVASLGAFGADKYSWNNWRDVPDGITRYSDALARHLTEEGQGEVVDDESGFLIAVHTAWNALARLELILEQSADARQIKKYIDDRLEQVRPETTPSPATTCKCGKTQPRSQGPSLSSVPPAGRAPYDWRRTEEVWQ